MRFSRREIFKAFLSTLFTLLVFPSWIAPREKPSKSHSTRVLFIGNSYTYFNNLPEIFTKLAENGHGGEVETGMVAPGGWRLKDHWEAGEALKALHERKWDYAVLQEQSTLGVTYFLEGRPRITGDKIFKPYAKKWAAEIRKAGATPVFYLTWARKAVPEDQAALNYAYMHAAKESGAQVAPVGIAWAQVRQQQPLLELYLADGSHPSPAGSYLAGCTLYATIFHQSPVGLPGKVSGIPVNLNTAKPEPEKTAVLVDLPADQAQTLQAAARAAWEQLKENGGYLDIPPVPVPAAEPLPAGTPLSAAKLEGTWSGNLLFYPSPLLPSEMVLQLYRAGTTWKGHLELKSHSRNQAGESLDLVGLRVGERELTFTDPKGLQHLKVHFRGVSAQADELRGIAEAASEKPGSSVRMVGTWQLHKK